MTDVAYSFKSREVVRGLRGGVHIAHPLSARALCGAEISERTGFNAYGGGSGEINGYNACRDCKAQTYSGGNESRALGAYS